VTVRFILGLALGVNPRVTVRFSHTITAKFSQGFTPELTQKTYL
jgi:hypothetical protein